MVLNQRQPIGPLHDPVTWYGINYTGTQITQWDFQNKGTCTSPARLSFVLKVPLRNLRPSVICSVPCDRIVQRAYCSVRRDYMEKGVQFNPDHPQGKGLWLHKGSWQLNRGENNRKAFIKTKVDPKGLITWRTSVRLTELKFCCDYMTNFSPG